MVRMASEMVAMPLKYPDDRHNGFVLLTDGNGTPYIPDFTSGYDFGSKTANALKYAGAFLKLAKKLHDHSK
jgi:hypothetical protein